MTTKLPRLTQAIDRRNANYLSEIEPEIYHIIEAELAAGATVADVINAAVDAGDPSFVRLVRSAARWMDGTK